jgi:hypothetical protein
MRRLFPYCTKGWLCITAVVRTPLVHHITHAHQFMRPHNASVVSIPYQRLVVRHSRRAHMPTSLWSAQCVGCFHTVPKDGRASQPSCAHRFTSRMLTSLWSAQCVGFFHTVCTKGWSCVSQPSCAHRLDTTSHMLSVLCAAQCVGFFHTVPKAGIVSQPSCAHRLDTTSRMPTSLWSAQCVGLLPYCTKGWSCVTAVVRTPLVHHITHAHQFMVRTMRRLLPYRTKGWSCITAVVRTPFVHITHAHSLCPQCVSFHGPKDGCVSQRRAHTCPSHYACCPFYAPHSASGFHRTKGWCVTAVVRTVASAAFGAWRRIPGIVYNRAGTAAVVRHR